MEYKRFLSHNEQKMLAERFNTSQVTIWRSLNLPDYKGYKGQEIRNAVVDIIDQKTREWAEYRAKLLAGRNLPDNS